MINTEKIKVKKIHVPSENEGQRVDNYLRKLLTGVPKSLIYKVIRDGQVRVNSKRVKPSYKLVANDVVRIPPISINEKPEAVSYNLIKSIKKAILFENDDLLIIDKPAGISVHSGSKIKNDIISSLKSIEKYKNLSLVNRLDQNTSGCLIMSKNYRAASSLGKQFQTNNVEKHYTALIYGSLKGDKIIIDNPLIRNRDNYNPSVKVSSKGKSALSSISLKKQFKNCCLVDIKIDTGRMHQIRVHAASINQPVCGDTKYGDIEVNKKFREYGLKRMFLHSKSVSFYYKKEHKVEAPLPNDLSMVIDKLKNEI